MSDTYCVMPFVGMYCETDRSLAPCCRYKPQQHVTKNPDKTLYDINEFETWWHDLALLREQLTSGIQAPGCEKCWQNESSGVTSYRQESNRRWAKLHSRNQAALPQPVIQMWGLTNICNLRCTFCSPNKSSTYQAHWHKNQDLYRIYLDADWRYLSHQSRINGQDHDMVTRIMSQAQNIDLTGGEPMMIPEYVTALKNIADPSKVVLGVTTNGTMISDQWVTLLKQFKYAHVKISLEGVGRCNDYIRPPSRWQDIETGVTRLREAGIYVSISHVWCRFSVDCLPALLSWCRANKLPIYIQDLYRPRALLISGSSLPERKKLIHSIDNLREADPAYFCNENMIKGLWSRLANLLELPYDLDVDRDFRRHIQGLNLLNGFTYDEVIPA